MIFSVVNAQNSIELKTLINNMSLEEKIGQLNQIDGRNNIEGLKMLISKGKVGSIMNITDPALVNELQKLAVEKSNTKIPLVFTRDVVHGFNTILPIPLGLAATFNPELVKQGMRNAAVEATNHGVKWAFAPMIDVTRDSRWGRVAEGFGEDTHLASVMGVAVVKGYQGNDLSENTSMAASAKHFVGYAAVEGGRDYNSTYIPERLLRETYIAPFKAAIDAGCASIMTSFNAIDGIPVADNKYLLHNVLRQEYNFNGVIFSDWGSIGELIVHGIAPDRQSAGAKAIEAGIDMDMSSRIYIETLNELVENGTVSETIIDSAVYHILSLKKQLNLFESPYVINTENIKNNKQSEEFLKTAYDLAHESLVLLKNNHSILPLSKEKVKKILIVGPLSNAPHDQMGTWNMDGAIELVRTPTIAFEELYGKDFDIKVINGLDYSRDKDTAQFAEVRRLSKDVDAIIAFVGEEAILSGEAHSLANIELKGAQKLLINVLKRTDKPLITVIMAGRPLTIENELNNSDALLYAWHPGTMGGDAIADVIFGKIHPKGKLPITFPKVVGQIPIYYNHYRIGRPAKEKEIDIDAIPLNEKQSVLGHTSSYLDVGSRPLFYFGYGLTYSTFNLKDMKLKSNILSYSDTLTLSLKIKNTGFRDATETLQLYITDEIASVARPVKELKDFKKIDLKAGETKDVHFSIPVSVLAFWNRNMKQVVESGTFKVMVGGDSQNGIETKFEIR